MLILLNKESGVELVEIDATLTEKELIDSYNEFLLEKLLEAGLIVREENPRILAHVQADGAKLNRTHLKELANVFAKNDLRDYLLLTYNSKVIDNMIVIEYD